MDRITHYANKMAMIRTSSAPARLSAEEEVLASALMECHGKVRVARESRGLHFYIPCPDCLQQDGEKELYSMHLAINVDRYFAGHNRACQCMKTGEVFAIDELTMWPPLEKRGFESGPGKILEAPILAGDYHEQDAKGNWVPKSPGLTVPLHTLPADHQAIQYLNSRQFSVEALEMQFQAAYVLEERKDIRYRRLLNGFRATSQGRIVLYAYVNGIRQGWQARILDLEDQHYHYYWHPYRESWEAVEYRETGTSPWEAMPEWEDFDPAKYVAAHGMRRNQTLIGFDAAVAFNAARPGKKRWCAVTEGPLDAGRFGPPAMATCGKFMSDAQAELLICSFDVIVIVPDNDAYGHRLVECAHQWIGARRRLVVVPPPKDLKDIGELHPSKVEAFRMEAMARAGLI